MIDCADRAIQSGPLRQMFTTLPSRYDLINHIITLGLDKWWRRKAARECLVPKPHKVLDLCCGTGDLTVSLARLAEKDVELAGIDYCQPMLSIATRKTMALTGKRNIQFIYGDATRLPFPDGSFDCVGISFAFRNLTYKNPLAWYHLAEVLRVLSTGGRYVIVETSQPKSKLMQSLYHLYLHWFVFRLGYLFSGNREAYHYLADSAAGFYTSQEVREMLLKTGFRQISFRPLLFGVAGIHIAVK